MPYFGDIKIEQGNNLLDSQDASPQVAHSAAPQTTLPDDPLTEEESFPLNKSEERLQTKLQEKAKENFVEMALRHPEIKPNSYIPPKVVLIKTPEKHIDAGYLSRNNTIYITTDQAEVKKERDFVVAHETAHKFDRHLGWRGNERRADTMASEVLGEQKAIGALHHFHKTYPKNDSKSFMARDLDNHEITVEREQNIKYANPDKKLKIPKHSKKILNTP